MDKYLDYKLDLSPDSRWNMVSATPSSKLSLLYLQESGDFIAGPGYFTTRRGFESFLIKLTVSGSGILSYRGSTYKVSPGQFYWIDCEQQHDYRTDPEVGEWHVLWVHFFGPSARYYYETFLNSNENGPVVPAFISLSASFGAMFSHINDFFAKINLRANNPAILPYKKW